MVEHVVDPHASGCGRSRRGGASWSTSSSRCQCHRSTVSLCLRSRRKSWPSCCVHHRSMEEITAVQFLPHERREERFKAMSADIVVLPVKEASWMLCRPRTEASMAHPRTNRDAPVPPNKEEIAAVRHPSPQELFQERIEKQKVNTPVLASNEAHWIQVLPSRLGTWEIASASWGRHGVSDRMLHLYEFRLFRHDSGSSRPNV